MTSSTESDKIDLILQVDAECGVLIETLWNVNGRIRSGSLLHRARINRNIMECKYDIGDTWNQENGVLIETLWNVKKF